MRKVILFSLMMFSGFFLSQNIAQDTGGGGASLEEPCESSVDDSGTIIVVTVCNRKTSMVGGFFGVSCGKDSDTQCQFTNVSPVRD